MASEKASFAIQDLLGLRGARVEGGRQEEGQTEPAKLEISIEFGGSGAPSQAQAAAQVPAGRPGKKARKRRRKPDPSSVGEESTSSESDGKLIAVSYSCDLHV